jgi:hypothetical protein
MNKREYKKEPSLHGYRIGCIAPNSLLWIGMFQVINHNGTRHYIDQNRNGVHGPKISFKYY